MRSTTFSCITYYLVATILISFSNGVPLDGENARDAKVNELPFVVALEEKDDPGSSFCVGTLISRQSVLTAAHCLFGFDYNQIEIVAGSPDLRRGKRYQIKSWIDYDIWKKINDHIRLSVNDIAVITLTKHVEGCSNPAPVIASARQDLDNTEIRIAGWGVTKDGERPKVLKTGLVKVIPDDVCKAKMEAVLKKPFHMLDNHFCSSADPWVLGGAGDSGAPVLNKENQVVGIHRSVSPASITKYNYTQEFINQNMVNMHLYVQKYKDFIDGVKV